MLVAHTWPTHLPSRTRAVIAMQPVDVDGRVSHRCHRLRHSYSSTGVNVSRQSAWRSLSGRGGWPRRQAACAHTPPLTASTGAVSCHACFVEQHLVVGCQQSMDRSDCWTKARRPAASQRKYNACIDVLQNKAPSTRSMVWKAALNTFCGSW